MGYILPFVFFEHKQYQERIVTDHKDSHPIERPYRVILEKEQGHKKKKYVNAEYWRVSIKPNVNKKLVDHIYARISGKGRQFNKRI